MALEKYNILRIKNHLTHKRGLVRIYESDLIQFLITEW